MRIDRDSLTFDEVVIAVAQAQRISKRKSSDIRQNVLYQYLKALDQFRLESDRQQQYKQAEKAHNKILSLRNKFLKKQIERVKDLQNQQKEQLQLMHKTKFQKFNSAWVDYMQDYQSKVFQQIDRLKQTHLFQMNQLQEQARQQFLQNMRPTKQVIQLRAKAKNLAKQKLYGDAAKAKDQAQKLHRRQLNLKRKQIQAYVKKKSQLLRRKQQKTLKALLKRIQKDRSQQLTKRKSDCLQMLSKIKNLKRQIDQRHVQQQKRVSGQLQNRLQSARISTGFSQRRSGGIGKVRSSSVRNVQRIFQRLHLYNP